MLDNFGGVKFAIGPDSRNGSVGRLGYCRKLIERCGLVAGDFWKPHHEGSKAQR